MNFLLINFMFAFKSKLILPILNIDFKISYHILSGHKFLFLFSLIFCLAILDKYFSIMPN